jgi:drug/metabolite transporter (DMT)-like permease
VAGDREVTPGPEAPARRPLGTVAADAILLTAALIWGTTFIAQKLATEHMGPVAFNGVRFTLGALILLPFALVRFRRIASARVRRESIVGGLLAGVAMSFGSSLQQVGMHQTSPSNAGFITGLYVIIVPMLGLFAGQRVGWQVWSGAVLAVAGLYFLSLFDPQGGAVAINTGDLWVLGCALAWSFHVQVIGWAAREADAFVISVVQFAVTGLSALLVSQLLAAFAAGNEWGAREAITMGALRDVAGPLLFATLLSTCIAFTLQTVAQGSAPPAHAAILLSLEGVVAALAEAVCPALGWDNLGAPFTRWKVLGCALMFAGVLVSQWRPGRGPAAPAGAG